VEEVLAGIWAEVLRLERVGARAQLAQFDPREIEELAELARASAGG
jgi:hypothetical protein